MTSLMIVATAIFCQLGGPLPPKAELPTPKKVTEFAVIASWYGPGFEGHEMAYGGRFDKNDPHIAAHKTFKPGTEVEVRLPNKEDATLIAPALRKAKRLRMHLKIKMEPSTETDKPALRLEVKDNGPHARGRDLDLTEAGAKLVGFKEEGVVILIARIVE